MKHSSKMILVPERTFENFQRQQRQEAPPTLTKMGELDNDMTTVLDNKEDSDEQKAKIYRNLLEKFLRFKNQRTLETEKPIEVSLADQKTPSKQSVEDIAELLPNALRSKAKMVLKRIEDNPDIVNWNDKGQLEYNGIVMPNTNIVDLVASSVRKRKKTANNPEGYDTFLKVLKKIEVSATVINADRVKEEIPKKDPAQVEVPSPRKRKTTKRNKRWLSVHE